MGKRLNATILLATFYMSRKVWVKDDNADVDDSGLWNPGWQNTRSCEVGQLKLAFSLDLVLDQKIYEYHITSQCLQLQSVLS